MLVVADLAKLRGIKSGVLNDAINVTESPERSAASCSQRELELERRRSRVSPEARAASPQAMSSAAVAKEREAEIEAAASDVAAAAVEAACRSPSRSPARALGGPVDASAGAPPATPSSCGRPRAVVAVEAYPAAPAPASAPDDAPLVLPSAQTGSRPAGSAAAGASRRPEGAVAATIRARQPPSRPAAVGASGGAGAASPRAWSPPAPEQRAAGSTAAAAAKRAAAAGCDVARRPRAAATNGVTARRSPLKDPQPADPGASCSRGSSGALPARGGSFCSRQALSGPSAGAPREPPVAGEAAAAGVSESEAERRAAAAACVATAIAGALRRAAGPAPPREAPAGLAPRPAPDGEAAAPAGARAAARRRRRDLAVEAGDPLPPSPLIPAPAPAANFHAPRARREGRGRRRSSKSRRGLAEPASSGGSGGARGARGWPLARRPSLAESLSSTPTGSLASTPTGSPRRPRPAVEASVFAAAAAAARRRSRSASHPSLRSSAPSPAPGLSTQRGLGLGLGPRAGAHAPGAVPEGAAGDPPRPPPAPSEPSEEESGCGGGRPPTLPEAPAREAPEKVPGAPSAASEPRGTPPGTPSAAPPDPSAAPGTPEECRSLRARFGHCATCRQGAVAAPEAETGCGAGALGALPAAASPRPGDADADAVAGPLDSILSEFAARELRALDEAEEELEGERRAYRALLLHGPAGCSKSLLLRRLHRAACSDAAAAPAGAAGLPVTVLLQLPEALAGREEEPGALRAAAAARLGLPAAALPALAAARGLVLLLDAFDELAGPAVHGPGLWDAHGIAAWASGTAVACRSELLEPLAPPALERLFGEEGGPPLRQLAALPFSGAQVRRYLRLAAGRPGERRLEAIRDRPDLAELVAEPLALAALARAPSAFLAEGGGAEGGRPALYRLLVREAVERRLRRAGLGGAELARLAEAGVELCRRLAFLLFRAEAERLLGDPATAAVRAACPLRRWRSAGARGYAFALRPLQECLAADALLASARPAPPLEGPEGAAELGARPLAGEPGALRALGEALRSQPRDARVAALLRAVAASRARVAPAPALLAAANAISVLVAGGVPLEGRDLRNIRVPGSVLRGARLAGSDLRGADLRGCDLRGADLRGCNLCGADLWGTRLGGRPALRHPAGLLALAWLQDGERIAAADEEGVVRVWDARRGVPLLQLPPQPVSALAAFPERGLLFCGCEDGAGEWWLVSGGRDGTVRVWDCDAQAEAICAAAHAGAVNAVAASADGERLASAGDDWRGAVLDGETGGAVAELRGHAALLSAVAFSADGARVVTGSWDKSARVWDAESGAELLQLWGHASALDALALASSPEGERVATGGWEGRVVLWDGATGAELARREYGEAIAALAFAPGGRALAAAGRDGGLFLWDLDRPAAAPDADDPVCLAAEMDGATRLEAAARLRLRELGATDRAAPAPAPS
eukprot:tig00000498_g1588.t1